VRFFGIDVARRGDNGPSVGNNTAPHFIHFSRALSNAWACTCMGVRREGDARESATRNNESLGRDGCGRAWAGGPIARGAVRRYAGDDYVGLL
jgi:hypothetical protein